MSKPASTGHIILAVFAALLGITAGLGALVRTAAFTDRPAQSLHDEGPYSKVLGMEMPRARRAPYDEQGFLQDMGLKLVYRAVDRSRI